MKADSVLFDGAASSETVQAARSLWQPRETAPRDGKEFFAWCMRRYPFSGAPSYFPDIARWSGKTPDDRVGHFASRSGDIVVYWMPIPAVQAATSGGER